MFYTTERLDELLGVKNENNAPEIDAEINNIIVERKEQSRWVYH